MYLLIQYKLRFWHENMKSLASNQETGYAFNKVK